MSASFEQYWYEVDLFAIKSYFCVIRLILIHIAVYFILTINVV